MDLTSVTVGSERTAPDARARKVQLATGLLISAVTLLLCLGGLELVAYFWERSTAQGPLGWTLVASRRLHLERHGSSDRPYYLFRPNEDYLWEGIPVHINSRGFRTEEFAVPKPAGTYRILNLGDSVTFGWEVRQEDTYGKQLERMLNTGVLPTTDDRPQTTDDAQSSIVPSSSVRRPTRYEVINAGIPAWTIEAERNFLLQEGLDYQPDMVIIDVTVVNDIYGRGPAVSEQQTVFQWLRDHTYFWPFLTTQARFLLAKQQYLSNKNRGVSTPTCERHLGMPCSSYLKGIGRSSAARKPYPF